MTKTLVYIKNNLIDSNGDIYLTIDSLIEINNITGSNNITLRKVIAKPYGFDKIYMDKELIEYKLYERSERKITSAKFFSVLLNKVHSFYEGNGTTCKILFANDDIIDR